MNALSLPVLGWFAALCVCAGAAVLGTGAARRAALFVAGGLIAAGSARSFAPPVWADPLAFLADIGLCIALASLAWKPQARWPLALVALQGLIVALDVLHAVEPDRREVTFRTATLLVGAALVATVAGAAWASRRRPGLSS